MTGKHTGRASGDPPAVLLMGPTAAGKTAVALALARRLPVGLISVDSAQVYRGLEIGSAKPDAATLARFPHALIDIRDPEQPYSAAAFVHDARAAMRDFAAAGRLPVLVGGTMLYHRALLYGLDRLPPADAAVRAHLEAEAAAVGWAALHVRLAAVDPISAARIDAGDPQRIQRALEVHALTGKPLSALHTGQRIRDDWHTLRLVVSAADRHILHQRIAKRLSEMVEAGFLDEVAMLRQRPGLSGDAPAMRAVGYRQAWQHLAGEMDHAGFVAAATSATRQLAKRQLTWLRKMPDGLWYDPGVNGTIDRIFRRVAAFYGRWADAGTKSTT